MASEELQLKSTFVFLLESLSQNPPLAEPRKRVAIQ
jgi:hypothetical protein